MLRACSAPSPGRGVEFMRVRRPLPCLPPKQARERAARTHNELRRLTARAPCVADHGDSPPAIRSDAPKLLRPDHRGALACSDTGSRLLSRRSAAICRQSAHPRGEKPRHAQRFCAFRAPEA